MMTNLNLRPRILELHEQGMRPIDIARKIGCTKSNVSYHIGKKLPLDVLEKRKTKREQDIENGVLICVCGGKKDKRANVCAKCIKAQKRDKWDNLTVGEKVYTKHLYAKFSYIRYLARTLAIEAGMTSCQKCGYDKHVEICHLKAVASYPPDTKISEINHISNLISLCPNCHWEMDHGK